MILLTDDADFQVSLRNAFAKADPDSVAFTAPTGSTVSLKAGTYIELAGLGYVFAVATAVQMPALTAGTDYAIYLCNDGTLRADANFSAPTGFTAATSRKIGGFHYAPGSNALAQAGGDAVAAINPYSLWDPKWRPACADPRGMALVADTFWCDIYLLGVDHHTNGTSRHGVTIADGGSPPKVPALFGGNGTTTAVLTQYVAAEIMKSAGKGLLDYAEFSAAAYGVSEAVQRGTDPVTTGLSNNNDGGSNADEKFTSKWGVVQAAGCMWTWGRDFSYRADGADAAAITGWSWKGLGRGSAYTQNTTGLVAALWGGHWGGGSYCGSRASYWDIWPWGSSAIVGARGRADHIRLP
jgi:hypothetical protein